MAFSEASIVFYNLVFFGKKKHFQNAICDIQERCTASILFTAKDMDLKHVMYMVVSPYDVQRTNGTLILILKQFFAENRKFLRCASCPHTYFFLFLGTDCTSLGAGPFCYKLWVLVLHWKI